MSIKNKKNTKNIGVILMTYGSPESIEDIPIFLKRIYGNREVEDELVREFKRRYTLIGMSPLVRITKQQAKKLEKELNTQTGHTYQFHVRAGMRFSKPFITDVVKELQQTTDHIIGIVLSPQFSPIIMNGYIKTLSDAVGKKSLSHLTIVRNWHLNELFLKAIKKSIKDAIHKLPKDVEQTIPILFTAHSMPKRVIEKEPTYIQSLSETADAVASLMKISKDRYLFCYQSAGHTPEEWLKPDFADIMPELKSQGNKYVLIAPVQFLSDHLETLYDIDIAAREQAEENGLIFVRARSLNATPLFIKALSSVVMHNMGTV